MCKFCITFSVLGILLCIAKYGVGQRPCKPGRIPEKKIDTAYLTVNKQDINTTVLVQLITAECYKVKELGLENR